MVDSVQAVSTVAQATTWWSAWTPFFPILGGGLVGSVATLLWQRFFKWFDAPTLQADFGGKDDGTAVPPSIDAIDGPDGLQQWIRLKVRNSGRSSASKVRVMIFSVENKSVQAPNWLFSDEIIDCGWSHIGTREIDIQKNTWRYADLFCLTKEDGRIFIKFTGTGADRMPPVVERLTLRIFVSGDNCATVTKTMTLQYNPHHGMMFSNQNAS